MTPSPPASGSQPPPQAEIIRGIFAGVAAGTATGTALLAGYGYLLPDGPSWGSAVSNMLPLGLAGAVMGCLHGLGAGITVGVSLRLMRRSSMAAAVVTAGLAAAATVTVIIQSIIATLPELELFSLLVGGFAGIIAAIVTPWIRRTPTTARLSDKPS